MWLSGTLQGRAPGGHSPLPSPEELRVPALSEGLPAGWLGQALGRRGDTGSGNQKNTVSVKAASTLRGVQASSPRLRPLAKGQVQHSTEYSNEGGAWSRLGCHSFPIQS